MISALVKSLNRGISRPSKLPIIGLIAGLALSNQHCLAGEYYGNATVGFTSVSHENFEGSGSFDLSASYQHSNLQARVGLFSMPKFTHKNDSFEGKITVKGLYAGGYYRFPINPEIHLEAGGGLVAAELVAELNDEELGSQNESAPYFHLQGFYPIEDKIAIIAGLKHIHQLGDNNFNTLEVGVRYSF